MIEKRLRALIASQLNPYTPVPIQLENVNRKFFGFVESVLKEFKIDLFAVETQDVKDRFESRVIFKPYPDAEFINMDFNARCIGIER